MQMHMLGRDSYALSNIVKQRKQHLARSANTAIRAVNMKQLPACRDRYLQALFDQPQMFVERAAQLRQLAWIGGFEGELKRFSG